MPTYEYQCDACDHAFEQFQSISAGALRKCPECGKMKLKRLISTGAGVIFKGSGFYETDYRSENYKKAAEAEKKAANGESDGAGGKEGKSDSSDSKSGESKSTENQTTDAKSSESKSTGTKRDKKDTSGKAKK